MQPQLPPRKRAPSPTSRANSDTPWLVCGLSCGRHRKAHVARPRAATSLRPKASLGQLHPRLSRRRGRRECRRKAHIGKLRGRLCSAQSKPRAASWRAQVAPNAAASEAAEPTLGKRAAAARAPGRTMCSSCGMKRFRSSTWPHAARPPQAYVLS